MSLINLVLMRNVGRRRIQTLPNRRPPPQSRRISRQIPLSQKSTGSLRAQTIPGTPKSLRRSKRTTLYLRLPIHKPLFINHGQRTKHGAAGNFNGWNYVVKRTSKRRASCNYVLLLLLLLLGGWWWLWSVLLLFGFGVCILLCIVAFMDDCIAWN